MREITLQEVLDARENRASSQKRLLAQYGKPLLGLTMNIAGPIKRSALGDLLFRETLGELWERVGGAIVHEERLDAATGLEAILVCGLPAEEVKALADQVCESCADGGVAKALARMGLTEGL